ncbi:MAG: hypothetical protein DRP00_04535 [Candidatus Aenigmatarchaeota archaeon]|nr:MAG: hypothetical protein DRP00_04535 [Candidatus Aenigmarchaeota archaeon]
MISIKLLSILVLLFLLLSLFSVYSPGYTGSSIKLKKGSFNKWYVVGKIEVLNGRVSSIVYPK